MWPGVESPDHTIDQEDMPVPPRHNTNPCRAFQPAAFTRLVAPSGSAVAQAIETHSRITASFRFAREVPS